MYLFNTINDSETEKKVLELPVKVIGFDSIYEAIIDKLNHYYQYSVKNFGLKNML